MAIKDLFKRVAPSQDEHDRSLVEELCDGISEVTATIGSLAPRVPATVAGEITNLRIVPARDGSAWLEATLQDGTGALILLWTGRQRIPGVRPGARLVVTGRPLPAGRAGRPTLYNPSYELLG